MQCVCATTSSTSSLTILGACVQEVILSANENPFGVPRALREAMNEAVAQSAFNRYPDPLADALREDIASWHGVSRDCVIVGNGGDRDDL